MWRWFLTVLSWAHLHLVEPIVRWWEEVVLGSWEEWLLALVRQAFEETTRFLNFVGAWLLDLINKQRYREHLRSAWQDNSWQQWWGEVASRPSTLNALVARVVAQQDKQAQQAAAQGTHSGANGTGETGSSTSHTAGFANGNGSLLSPAPSPPPAHWWSRGQPQAPSPAAPGAGSGAGVGAPGSSLASAGRSGSGGGLPAAGPPPPLPPRTERPVVFTPARYGMGLLDELAKRRQGLIEEAKMAAQLAVSRAFEFLRRLVRTVFLLPPREGEEGYGPATQPPSRAHSSAPSAASGAFSSGPGPSGADDGASEAGASGRGVRWRLAEAEAEGEGGASRSGRSSGGPSSGSRRGWGGHGAGAGAGGGSGRRSLHRSKSAHVDMAGMDRQPGTSAGAPSAAMARRGLRRSRSSGRPLGGAADVWGHHATDIPSDALSVIRAAGYPHELHTVTTSDGYLLRLERIPRPGARDTVFFMHGVLDTSMAWVSGGVTGSQAFAAWEAGMDVWLGNSRGNAPRQHQDPSRRGGFSYWRYNINHMGMYDIAAQLDHIHNIKCAELGAGTVTLDLDHLGPLAGSFFRPTPGPASGLGGSGPLPASAAGAGRGLPGRMATAAAPGSGAQDGPAGGQRTPPSVQGSRMRPSNSDGNLHRWGSLHSAASGGSAGGGGGAAGAAGGAAAEAGAGAGSGGRPQGPHAPPVPAQGAQGPPRLSPLPSSAEASAGEGEGSERSGGSDGNGEGGAGPRPGPEAGPATATASGPGSGSGRAGGVRSRAVTLTVRGQGLGGEGRGLSGEGAGGEGAAGAGARTFTLAAKTRTDFGRGASLDGGPRPLPAPLEPPPAVGGGGGSVAGSAAAMLDAVGFVLGPAAGAVSHAMTAAAATAGAAAATAGAALATAAASAAASAAHLMPPSLSASSRPASPVRPAAIPAAPAAAASPFAAAPAQVLAAAAGAGADVEGAPLDEGGAEALPAGASAAGSAARVVEGWLGVARGLGWASPVRGAAAAPASAPQPGKGAPPCPCPCPEEAAVADARETSELAAAAAEAAAVAAAAAAAGSGSSPFASATSSAPDDSGGGRDGSYGARADAAPAAAAAAASASPQRPPTQRGPFPAPSPGAPPAPPLLPPLHGSGSFRRALSTDQLGAAAAAWAAKGGGGGLGSAPVWTWRGSAQALGERAGSGFSMGSGGGGGEAGDAGGGSTPPPGAPRSPAPPYKLRCVAHSLGGMSMLIHTVNRLREGRPHHIARLLLLTPAGFHEHHPRVTHPVRWALPKLAAFIRSLPGCRGLCFPLYIPTPLARGLVFKLLTSLSRIPGLGEALRRMYAFLLDGDVSEWDRALQMPQYGAEDMPAISLDQVLHLIQLAKRHTFQLYDYGSPAANTAHYGTPQPPHVDREYWRLDLPVHLVAGRRDGVIPPANVRRHFEAMRAQGVAVSYREFDFGHLDFTLGVKEEVRMYLMKLLRL
ncbi:hypothetical protein HYH03_018172 [Edaphochlamys debaryana]|uniref:Partial AB-hydrolase lipase domain-containing protein n=1 Tax=Edaphochlamys debaryana TaxID=47281 RepID=A0A835XH24_9CHLO|nr:hypothetical protein HYH03_018172 [Edaphochlamys debaryana]|eukprot:KAG2482947.1 hypothetical protein HYH03_018172 [Edaphochlamys debaryana]